MAEIKLEKVGKYYKVAILKQSGWYVNNVLIEKKDADYLLNNSKNMSSTQIGYFLKENRKSLKDRFKKNRIKALLKGDFTMFSEWKLEKKYIGRIQNIRYGSNFTECILRCGCTLVTLRVSKELPSPKLNNIYKVCGRWRTADYYGQARAFLFVETIEEV